MPPLPVAEEQAFTAVNMPPSPETGNGWSDPAKPAAGEAGGRRTLQFNIVSFSARSRSAGKRVTILQDVGE
jgi:hypothetical protein